MKSFIGVIGGRKINFLPLLIYTVNILKNNNLQDCKDFHVYFVNDVRVKIRYPDGLEHVQLLRAHKMAEESARKLWDGPRRGYKQGCTGGGSWRRFGDNCAKISYEKTCSHFERHSI
jgi:hypothetical protein